MTGGGGGPMVGLPFVRSSWQAGNPARGVEGWSVRAGPLLLGGGMGAAGDLRRAGMGGGGLATCHGRGGVAMWFRAGKLATSGRGGDIARGRGGRLFPAYHLRRGVAAVRSCHVGAWA